MEDTSQAFKTDIVKILEDIVNQSKGTAKKVCVGLPDGVIK